jgi:hypothetical protein
MISASYTRLDDFTNVDGSLYFVASRTDGDSQLWTSEYQPAAFGFVPAENPVATPLP